jgi:hypothetical protein
MNKSPDTDRERSRRSNPADDRLFLDLAAESRVQSDETLSNHPELASDRALRDELAQLEPPALPDALRSRVLAEGRPRRRPASWMALAAAVVLSVMLVIALDREPAAPGDDLQSISASDWMELQLALNTLDASGRRMARMTEAELQPHFARPVGPLDIDLPSIPTLEALLQRFERSLRPTR